MLSQRNYRLILCLTILQLTAIKGHANDNGVVIQFPSARVQKQKPIVTDQTSSNLVTVKVNNERVEKVNAEHTKLANVVSGPNAITYSDIDKFFMSPGEFGESWLMAHKIALLEQGSTDAHFSARVNTLTDEQQELRAQLANPEARTAAQRSAYARSQQYKRLLRIRTLDVQLADAIKMGREFHYKIAQGQKTNFDEANAQSQIDRLSANMADEIRDFTKANSRVGSRGGAAIQFNSETLISRMQIALAPSKVRLNPLGGSIFKNITVENPIPEFSAPGAVQ